MSAYWVARCHVTDPKKYAKYAELAGPAIEKHGGRFLARGGEQIEVEGKEYERTVLVEFASFEKAHACYCLLYTSPSPRDRGCARMPSSA